MVREMDDVATVLPYALASWLVPLVSSLPFFGRDGKLTVDKIAFKSVMVVVGVTSGCALMKSATRSGVRDGPLLGLSFLLVNWIGDIIFLVHFAKMPFKTWFVEIGVRYLPMLALAYVLTTE